MRRFAYVAGFVVVCVAVFFVVRMGLSPQAENASRSLAGSGDVVLAVSYFDNVAKDTEFEPLKKGLAEMLVTDFSNVPGMRVVERNRLNEVLKEIQLQKNPYFDTSSVAKLGKGLGASFLVTGSYTMVSNELVINARVVDVENSEVTVATKETGNPENWLDIYRTISQSLIEGLAGKLSPLQAKKIGRSNTASYSAFQSFAASLDSLDKGDADGAARHVDKALSTDPDFAAAKAQKERVEALRKTFDLNLYNTSVASIAKFEAGEPCVCNYKVDGGKFPENWESLSAGARLAKRMIQGQMGRRPATENMTPLMVAADLTKVGLYDEARKLVDIFLSADYLKQVGPKSLQRCMGYQFRSLLHYLQLELEDAMSWQVKSTEIPLKDYMSPIFREQCLSGMGWSMLFGFEGLSGPLKDRIVAATDGANVDKLRRDMQLIRQVAPRLRTRIDDMKKSQGCSVQCGASGVDTSGGLRGLQIRMTQGDVSVQVLEAFLDSGVEPTNDLLLMVMMYGKSDLITPLGKLLLDKGAVPNKTAVRYARMKRHRALAKAMKKRISDAKSE